MPYIDIDTDILGRGHFFEPTCHMCILRWQLGQEGLQIWFSVLFFKEL